MDQFCARLCQSGVSADVSTAARSLNAGGVGFYPHFVHIDVGRVGTGDHNLPFWGSIQPSISPQPGRGTEMLMSTTAAN